MKIATLFHLVAYGYEHNYLLNPNNLTLALSFMILIILLSIVYLNDINHNGKLFYKCFFNTKLDLAVSTRLVL
jgi:hypothetical protein